MNDKISMLAWKLLITLGPFFLPFFILLVKFTNKSKRLKTCLERAWELREQLLTGFYSSQFCGQRKLFYFSSQVFFRQLTWILCFLSILRQEGAIESSQVSYFQCEWNSKGELSSNIPYIRSPSIAVVSVLKNTSTTLLI